MDLRGDKFRNQNKKQLKALTPFECEREKTMKRVECYFLIANDSKQKGLKGYTFYDYCFEISCNRNKPKISYQ